MHFPIALIPIALLFDLWGLLSKQRWATQGGVVLWVLAAGGAGAAYWAGEEAADSLIGVPPAAQSHIADHSDWALYTLWAVGVVAALRLVVAVRDQRRGQSARGPLWALFAIGLVPLALVLRTADLGGGLVFQEGVAVRANTAAGPSDDRSTGSESPLPDEAGSNEVAAEATSPEARLVKRPDGTLEWTPLATDGEALGSLLVAAPGSSLEAVRVAEPVGDSEGLRLDVDGEAMLLLPGTFGDVQIDAVLDLSAFDGTVGLVHHVRSADTAGLFSASTSGTMRLVVLDGGREQILEEQVAALPDQPVELAVSSAGRHLKGLVDGKTVAHGHEEPGEAGGCGLWLDGSGTVRLITLRLTPLE